MPGYLIPSSIRSSRDNNDNDSPGRDVLRGHPQFGKTGDLQLLLLTIGARLRSRQRALAKSKTRTVFVSYEAQPRFTSKARRLTFDTQNSLHP